MGLHVCKLAHSGVIRHSSLRTSRLSFVWNGSVCSITDWKQNHFQQQEESFLSHRLVVPHIRQFYSASLIMDVHIKARCKVYPRTTDVNRFDVPDHKVKWEDEFPEYARGDLKFGFRQIYCLTAVSNMHNLKLLYDSHFNLKEMKHTEHKSHDKCSNSPCRH